jgi:hypothetical protein
MTLKSMLSVTCGETTLKIKALNRDCDSETINIMRLKSGFTARADEFTETIRKYGDFIVCRVEAVDAYTIKIVCVYP